MTDEPKATPRDIAYECVPKDIAQNWREEIVDRIEEVLNQSVNDRSALLAKVERYEKALKKIIEEPKFFGSPISVLQRIGDIAASALADKTNG
jgi:hypothetical protein